jgi:hypothetical protein
LAATMPASASPAGTGVTMPGRKKPRPGEEGPGRGCRGSPGQRIPGKSFSGNRRSIRGRGPAAQGRAVGQAS